MGFTTVIITFIMSILFNVFLPTGDIGSDLNLMYQVLNYDLGESLELQGCKACYHKTEKEVYYSENGSIDDKCDICLYNPNIDCGRHPSVVRKLNELETNAGVCLKNESVTLNIDAKGLESPRCDKDSLCCITQKQYTEKQINVAKPDPKKLFRLITATATHTATGKREWFYVVGRSNFLSCFKALDDFYEKFLTLNYTKYVVFSSSNEKTYFYPLSKMNQSFVLEEKGRPITDPDIQCGILEIDISATKQNTIVPSQHNYYCNENACLTHLEYLHAYTSMWDLAKWRKTTDYMNGVKVGGVTCHLLKIYGSSIIIPILLNLFFNVVWYVKDVREKKANLVEVIPLVLLFYPQYKTLKYLAQYLFVHRDENRLNKDKEDNDRSIAHLEPFVESSIQVNISLAILFAVDGFFPKGVWGEKISEFKDFSSALPLVTFVLSLFASSFGTSKFLLNGPIQFISNDSALNGMLSVPFLCLCILNAMFGCRIICIESSFFTSYRSITFNESFDRFDREEISPLIHPEYRLMIYLAPCIIPFLINAFKLYRTTKGLWKYFLQYPQFLISPCFTPFLFEGYESTDQHGKAQLKIWKRGTITNAIYIGFVPQCILLITDYVKGAYHWRYQNDSSKPNVDDDALFKSLHGNTIFAVSTAIFFLSLIVIFFNNKSLFKERGIHCKCLTILCCPCPNSCVNYTDLTLESEAPHPDPCESEEEEMVDDHTNKEQQETSLNEPKTEVYLYTRKGEKKFHLFSQASEVDENDIPMIKKVGEEETSGKVENTDTPLANSNNPNTTNNENTAIAITKVESDDVPSKAPPPPSPSVIVESKQIQPPVQPLPEVSNDSERNALLGSIRGFDKEKLKRCETVDKSAPKI